MKIEIPVGIEYRSELIVDNQHTATKYGSGLAEVFATPALVALMENAAYKSIEMYLPDGYSSVGTEIHIQHLRATPPGDKVYAISKTVAFDGRKVDFEVEAFDSNGLIGKGTHQRFVVNSARFIDKLKGKSEK